MKNIDADGENVQEMEAAGIMKQDQRTFLVGLKTLLNYHGQIGIGAYPLSRELRSFLQLRPIPAKESAATPGGEARPAVSAPQARKASAPAARPLGVKLADIAEEVVSCRACDLHKQRVYPVVGRGPEKVRLVIVGDWLSTDQEGRLSPGHLFGNDQDRMLARMLAAIDLPVEEVFITNVIKCAVPASVQPQAVHVQSCVSYLRRQIAVLAPEAILAMGMVTARMLLEKSQPLSRLRGRFHDYEAAPGLRIPILATYHPTYLLQNPEMKQATWADLQLLARQLGLTPHKRS